MKKLLKEEVSKIQKLMGVNLINLNEGLLDDINMLKNELRKLKGERAISKDTIELANKFKTLIDDLGAGRQVSDDLLNVYKNNQKLIKDLKINITDPTEKNLFDGFIDDIDDIIRNRQTAGPRPNVPKTKEEMFTEKIKNTLGVMKIRNPKFEAYLMSEIGLLEKLQGAALVEEIKSLKNTAIGKSVPRKIWDFITRRDAAEQLDNAKNTIKSGTKLAVVGPLYLGAASLIWYLGYKFYKKYGGENPVSSFLKDENVSSETTPPQKEKSTQEPEQNW
jgi:hypothetical protein